jgi:hypothetical protein
MGVISFEINTMGKPLTHTIKYYQILIQPQITTTLMLWMSKMLAPLFFISFYKGSPFDIIPSESVDVGSGSL